MRNTKEERMKRKLDAAMDLNKNSMLVYVALHLMDFALLEMENNPLLTHGRKRSASKKRIFCQNYLKQIERECKGLGLEEKFNKEDDLAIDRVAVAANHVNLISQLPDDQLDYVTFAFEEICQKGVLNNIQNQINDGTLLHHTWSLGTNYYEFVHNYKEGKIEHLLGEAIKELGQDITMDQFIYFCKARAVICCRVTGLSPIAE